MQERLSKQLHFLAEIDKMKSILRQTILLDQSRQETDAEHSWHFAVMAMILAEYAYTAEVKIERVLQMALVHDLVEIYAGDTYAYDENGNADKNQREQAAADRLFAILPADQGSIYHELWKEFEQMESPDALYANAMDCAQPILNNYLTQGKMWREHQVSSAHVYQRMERIRKGAPEVYTFFCEMIEDAIEKNYLRR